MTDIAFGHHAADAAPARAVRRRPARRRGAVEYHAYHGVVLAAALPFAVLAFAADALRGRPGASPLRRAQRQAWAITPMIFAP